MLALLDATLRRFVEIIGLAETMRENPASEVAAAIPQMLLLELLRPELAAITLEEVTFAESVITIGLDVTFADAPVVEVAMAIPPMVLLLLLLVLKLYDRTFPAPDTVIGDDVLLIATPPLEVDTARPPTLLAHRPLPVTDDVTEKAFRTEKEL